MILIEEAKNLSNVEHVFHTMNNLMKAQEVTTRASRELIENNSFIAEKSLNKAEEFISESKKHYLSLLSVDRRRLDTPYNELLYSLGINIQNIRKRIKLSKSVASRSNKQIPQTNEQDKSQ